MKLRRSLGAMFVFASFCVMTVHTEAAEQRYGIRSAIVDYTVTTEGPVNVTSNETLYIDRHGEVESRIRKDEVSIFGITQITETMHILRDGKSYNIDLTTNRGTVMDLKETFDAMKKGTNSGTMLEVGEKAIERFDGKEIGRGEVAGFPCIKYFFEQFATETCVYKGLALRSVSELGGMKVIYEAQRVQENVPIPQDKVHVPKDVQLTQAPDIAEAMSKMRTPQNRGRQQAMEEGNWSTQVPEGQQYNKEEINAKMEEALGAFKALMEESQPR